MSTAAAAVSPAESLRRRSREALSALAVQFLLGMAANLIGEPEGTFAIVVDTIIVILHILVAIGLVVIASAGCCSPPARPALGERARALGSHRHHRDVPRRRRHDDHRQATGRPT